MHIEKNVALTAVGFLLGELDTLAVRKDAQQENVLPHIHLVPDDNGKTFQKPHAHYDLSKEEKLKLLRTIHLEVLPASRRGLLPKGPQVALIRL
ncbi:hypothetical protein KC19_VG186800 [Ceratodon purpureus]|uniref:Uncharacterized protein n=1 Tax=Ceratodon purpureus TaxID=3225 RepID=A0A8T0HRG0_CERPU|nr:hypothetical protein KC19_VG186800 [Ceratodon purpureus]